jgi:hypothetical protein
MTTFREVCGTLRGMLAHQAAGESPCGWCAQAERAARLAAEALQLTPPAPVGGFLPVTEEEASVHREVLETEVAAFERDHLEDAGRDTGHRHLWRVA